MTYVKKAFYRTFSLILKRENMMKFKTPAQVKNQIEKIAKDFNLKYKSEWFDFMWISIRYEILTEYIGGCWDSIYKKYGKTTKQRAKNIDKFVNSGDFQKCLKRYGGQIFDLKSIKEDIKIVNLIENKKLRNELVKFYDSCLKKLKNNGLKKMSAITKPRNEKEKKWQIEYCLREEWLHNLMKYNCICYQNKNKNYWVYDEGIATFFAYYLDKKLNQLEKARDKEKLLDEKKYYTYAIKFRELFKTAKTAKERELILRTVYKN